MKIFVVIALRNERKHVTGVLKGLKVYKLPIIIVDDGSKDGSDSLIKKLRFKNVSLLRHAVNLGKGAAMKTGAEFAFAKGADAVIFMDADGQHKSTDIPKFIEALKNKDLDVVLGSRNLNMGIPLFRYLGNKIASVVSAFVFGSYVSDAICGFRAVSKEGYKKIKWDSTGYDVEMEMIARIGIFKMRYSEVPVEAVYYDKVKGVTLFDAFNVFGQVVKWRFMIKI